MAQVVTEEAAIPFAIITGRETESSDYKGITKDVMKVRIPVQEGAW